MKKLFFVACTVMIVLALGTSLVGCAKSSDEALTFHTVWDENSGRTKAIMNIVDEYNAQEGVRQVEVLPAGTQQTESLLTSQAEILMLDARVSYDYSRDTIGLLADITADFTDLSAFDESVINTVKHDGNLYSVPWMGHSMAVLYNNDLLTEHGLDINAIDTDEEFADAVSKVKIGLSGKKNGDTSWMSNMFVESFGGRVMNDNGEVTYDSENTREGLKYYFETLGAHAQAGWNEDTAGDAQLAFLNGEVGFLILGPWGVSDLMKKADRGDETFEYGAIEMSQIKFTVNGGEVPGKAETAFYSVSINDLVVENDKDREDAVTFIAYLTSKEASENIMDGEYNAELDKSYPFRVPIRQDVDTTGFFAEFPAFLPFMAGFANPATESPAGWQPVRDNTVITGLNLLANKVVSGDSLTDADYNAYIESVVVDAQEKGLTIAN